MAQFGKASSKRGKPTYAYAIIGVAVVLFLFGIVGWFFLNLRKTGDYVKENIQVHAWLNPNAPVKKVDSMQTYIKSIPYVKNVQYVTKEMAIEKWNKDNDTTWKAFLENNPLPESIDFYIKSDYVQKDSLDALSLDLLSRYPGVINEFQFPTETINQVSKFVKTAAIIFLVAAVVLTILVVFSIDNTIRLAMYSNRFLIKTMQMVGATRGFIARPINIRAIINGLISSAIAIIAVWFTVMFIESMAPSFKVLHDNASMILLFLAIIVLGISISLFSTHRSVIKYLRMKLDDLY
ncbi:MAG TPA: permease-like cell division protein FtsX [Ferruginibacter sp.]|jgi:cell division transport system permease protein|nr:permease-like cell division protein FtsX [Ferruginibacter sp.]